jgi:putative ABC transport system ATP-binding protein
VIELVGVHKVFNPGRPNAHPAVRGVDLEIPGGRVTAFTGPSGSGKTTLLALVGCLARPSEGRVRVAGRDVSALPERFLAAERRHTFGFVFQDFNLIRGLSVRENVLVPALPTGRPRRELLARAEALLARLGLGHRAHAPAGWLSGGEAQRVAIARALINDPRVVIADEPTANLDSALSRGFLDIVAELKAEGRTVLLASHDPLVYGAPVVDRVVALRDGRLAEAEP